MREILITACANYTNTIKLVVCRPSGDRMLSESTIHAATHASRRATSRCNPHCSAALDALLASLAFRVHAERPEAKVVAQLTRSNNNTTWRNEALLDVSEKLGTSHFFASPRLCGVQFCEVAAAADFQAEISE